LRRQRKTAGSGAFERARPVVESYVTVEETEVTLEQRKTAPAPAEPMRDRMAVADGLGSSDTSAQHDGPAGEPI
jgi:hypothetical protein